MKVNGIIVQISPYRDHGAMINLLTNDNVLAFYARNIYKMDNKNVLLTSPLLHGEFTFSDSAKKLLTFKEVSPIVDTRVYLNDLMKLTSINFLNEVTVRLFSVDDMPQIYSYLAKTIALLNNKNQIPSLLLSYLAVTLRLTGFGLNVDSCVVTGSKENIVGVSYLDGGFVSKSAYKRNRHKLYSPIKCQILRKIFKLKSEDLTKVNFPTNEVFEILNDLFIYTYDQTGIRFKSERLLNKML